jgi:hypothetical protein
MVAHSPQNLSNDEQLVSWGISQGLLDFDAVDPDEHHPLPLSPSGSDPRRLWREAATPGDSPVLRLAKAIRENPWEETYLDSLPAIPAMVRELILARFDAAYAEGWLDLSNEQYEQVMMVLLPDDFPVPKAPIKASTHPAGSPGRLADCQRRAALAQPTDYRGDADAVRDDRLGVAVSKRANGDGVHVHGWAG